MSHEKDSIMNQPKFCSRCSSAGLIPLEESQLQEKSGEAAQSGSTNSMGEKSCWVGS